MKAATVLSGITVRSATFNETTLRTVLKVMSPSLSTIGRTVFNETTLRTVLKGLALAGTDRFGRVFQ